MPETKTAFKTRGEAETERKRLKDLGEYWNDIFMSAFDVLNPFYVGTYFGFVNREHDLNKNG